MRLAERRGRWIRAVLAALCAIGAAACRGETSIAPNLSDAALMSLRPRMRADDLRAALGEPLAVVVRPGAPGPETAVSRWRYAGASCRAVGPLALGCRGVHAEATLVGDALVFFEVSDAETGWRAFECSEVACPVVPDRDHLRYLLEHQRGR